VVFTKGKVGGNKHDAFDPYEYLGVNENDNFIDIIQSFRDKMLKDHPHLIPDNFEAN
jgi:preprotein translocase subunit Sec63